MQVETNDKEFLHAHSRSGPHCRDPHRSRRCPAAALAQQRLLSRQDWQDSQGRLRCKRPNGTTGLIVGAAGGALIGRAIDTRGERATGTILGAAAGALIGREIDRSRGHAAARSDPARPAPLSTPLIGAGHPFLSQLY